MTTLNVSLPTPLKRYIEKQTAAGGYSTTSEYVRELIRGDRERKAMEQLEVKLLEGIASGPAKQVQRADWDQLRRELKVGRVQRGGK